MNHDAANESRPGRWMELVAPSRGPNSGTVLGILPGEGVGPEVIGAALKVLDAIEAIRGQTLERRIGGAIGLAASPEFDGILTEDIAAFCQSIFDDRGAVFCGPGGGRFVYDLRRRFSLYCKLAPLRPITCLRPCSPLRAELMEGVDMLVVRDNVGGIYQGTWTMRDADEGRVAEHGFAYTEAQVMDIVSAGARLARARRGRMDVVVKDGGIPSVSDLWRSVAQQVAGEMGVELACPNADFAAYAMVCQPQRFDVIVTPNMAGDILADLGAVFLGSRGLSFSGNFSACGHGAYQTGHGAARDLAGTDRANPLGQILSLAMMLRESYGWIEEAALIERAVESVVASGHRTDDIMEAGLQRVGTQWMGELVAAAVGKMATSEVRA